MLLVLDYQLLETLEHFVVLPSLLRLLSWNVDFWLTSRLLDILFFCLYRLFIFRLLLSRLFLFWLDFVAVLSS